MDRIDAMKVFVAALDEGSLAGAARRLRRSPIMPYVSIALTRKGTEPGVAHVTAERKAAIYKSVSQILFEVLARRRNAPGWSSARFRWQIVVGAAFRRRIPQASDASEAKQ